MKIRRNRHLSEPSQTDCGRERHRRALAYKGKKERASMKKTVRIILLVLCLTVFLFSGTMIVRELLEYRRGDQAYEALEKYVEMIPAGNDGKTTQADGKGLDSSAFSENKTAGNMDAELSTPLPTVDFDALREINSDVVGWLYSPETIINYPVAQAQDNDYYLHHRFDRVPHKAGCIFMDAGNNSDLSDPHTILYGHHMKNTSMFGTLTNYKKQEYYEEHSTIYLLTPRKNYAISVFAGYVSPGDGDAWKLKFTDQDERSAWVQAALERSTFNSGMVPSPEDQIITLSTCSYEYDNARYVLLGILTPLK